MPLGRLLLHLLGLRGHWLLGLLLRTLGLILQLKQLIHQILCRSCYFYCYCRCCTLLTCWSCRRRLLLLLPLLLKLAQQGRQGAVVVQQDAKGALGGTPCNQQRNEKIKLNWRRLCWLAGKGFCFVSPPPCSPIKLASSGSRWRCLAGTRRAGGGRTVGGAA